MKMKKYILLFAVALTGVSCSNLLDTESSGNLTPEDFEKVDQNKLTSTMLNGAIAYMHTMGNANLEDGVSYKVLGIRMDMLGNDMVLGGNGSGWFVSDYNMANYRGQDDERPSTYWGSFYRLIYKANQVISYIDPTELTESEKAVSDNIKAQALTLRALGYYHLITVFQDAYLFGGSSKSGVPVYTIPDEARKGRGTAQQVWNRIFQDCSDAIALFTSSGVNPKSKTEVSIYVAYMIQARAALTTGDYKLAAEAAGKVVDAFGLMTFDDAYTDTDAGETTNAFQQIDGVETIWGYKWSQNTTLQNMSFASHMAPAIPSSMAYGSVYVGGTKLMDNRLWAQIPDTDWRGALYSSIQYSGTVYYSLNWKFDCDSWDQDEVYMRAAEAYFIKAEAEASGENPDYAAAQQTLYDIMSTRDQAYTKSVATGDELLEEIRLNKRVEMWGEGLEFFDNKRINKGVNRKDNPFAAYGVPMNHRNQIIMPAGKDFTFRIPRSGEIELNPEISDEDQNPL